MEQENDSIKREQNKLACSAERENHGHDGNILNFAPLRDKAVFERFDLDGWTVCWLDGTVDIAPEHLYEMGVAA